MRRPRISVLLLTTLALLAGARWIDVHPVTFRADEAESVGAALRLDRAADILLLVDPAEVTGAGGVSFEAADWSYGWVNLAEQEFGRFAVAAPQDDLDLSSRRVVIVTRSAREHALVWRTDLRGFVESGGLLVVEQPGDAWSELTRAVCGAEVTGELSLGGADVETATELALVPRLPGTVRALDAEDGADVLLRSGTHAVGTLARHGRGAVLALGLDVGRAVTALQQGTPQTGTFGVANRHPDVLTDHIQSNDLVADPSLLGATVPVADVLERVVARLLDSAGPLPRWWPYPDAAPGAYVVTHDEESMGDDGAWMAEAEIAWGHAGSDYVVCGRRFTAEGVARMAAPDRTLGLHYVDALALGAPRRELGIGPFRPLVRPWTLAEQADGFEALVGRAPRSNRNHYLLWDTDYARPFRRMAAVGITVDTTYGPDVGTRGYLFGTGLPFRALDQSGLPLPIRELPFQTAEDLGGADRDFVFRLLQESATRHHQPITTLFHPNVYAWRPDVAIYETWRDAFGEAERLGLVVTDLEELADFVASRGESALRSTWAQDTLSVTASSNRPGLTVTVPAEWRSRAAVIHLDGEPVHGRPMSYAAGDVLLVPVPLHGAHRIRVEYPEVAR